SRGFEFAWDPNTTFQLPGFGMGWEATAKLGLTIGLGIGIIIVILLEIFSRRNASR
ncbi:MAG: hypothetical protein HYV34_04345, partial [Candidatus Kerfeldbacteria bacterium]|nr:hypothetical protein [Candidatus Kerfeldbacteria bacterium]